MANQNQNQGGNNPGQRNDNGNPQTQGTQGGQDRNQGGDTTTRERDEKGEFKNKDQNKNQPGGTTGGDNTNR